MDENAFTAPLSLSRSLFIFITFFVNTKMEHAKENTKKSTRKCWLFHLQFLLFVKKKFLNKNKKSLFVVYVHMYVYLLLRLHCAYCVLFSFSLFSVPFSPFSLLVYLFSFSFTFFIFFIIPFYFSFASSSSFAMNYEYQHKMFYFVNNLNRRAILPSFETRFSCCFSHLRVM